MLSIALKSGFWNRLMAGIANTALATANWVVELAASFPTSTIISHTEAGSILNLGFQARQASIDWLSGVPTSRLVIPSVPIPPSPNIDGGPPGSFDFGVVLKGSAFQDEGFGSSARNVNVLFSADKVIDVGDMILRLDQYARENRKSSPRGAAFASSLAEQLMSGSRNVLVPNYLVERLPD